MKKIFIIALCLIASIACFARKSYVHVYAAQLSNSYGHALAITGDVPANIERSYFASQQVTIGQMLNMLAGEGFELEFVSSPTSTENYTGTAAGIMLCYVLSKQIADSDSGDQSGIRTVKNDDADDVYEVARYNLQGLPVSPSEKGVQIVVYSNYTTRTVINE